MTMPKFWAVVLLVATISAPLIAQTESREVTVTRTTRDFYQVDGSSRFIQVRDCGADAVARKVIITRVKGTGSTPTKVTIKFLGEFYEQVCKVVRIID
jgi:hypothetical protein